MMTIEIKPNPMKNTLKLPSKVNESLVVVGQEPLEDSNTPQEITLDITPSPTFYAIYKELHSKFPETINLDKPVLLAVGIRKQMSQEIGISSVILKQWTSWYFRKSNYYAQHNEGAIRYNLDGSEAGIVTEKHHEKMNKFFERLKKDKSETDDNKSKDSDIR